MGNGPQNSAAALIVPVLYKSNLSSFPTRISPQRPTKLPERFRARSESSPRDFSSLTRTANPNALQKSEFLFSWLKVEEIRKLRNTIISPGGGLSERGCCLGWGLFRGRERPVQNFLLKLWLIPHVLFRRRGGFTEQCSKFGIRNSRKKFSSKNFKN